MFNKCIVSWINIRKTKVVEMANTLEYDLET